MIATAVSVSASLARTRCGGPHFGESRFGLTPDCQRLYLLVRELYHLFYLANSQFRSMILCSKYLSMCQWYVMRFHLL